ncbi:anti-sigma-M factor yhdL [Neobacillus bataviensis LMG 21833]|uniref:Anti-sigma-M factor yhdL n=1 Tax=Neobacillus bataviensis LMG 21833 TaxID=1117379 RepID=K6DS55_9BACI|nr:anti-sigma factor [Neobacillus bataviensis]EKN71058.1 anti-sigma-M factor yhdL [Neobacillus bataviensis LMG 21833]
MSDEKKGFEEDYQDYLKESLNEVSGVHPYSEKSQTEIVTIGKNMARRTNIMISLAILLLIVPVMTLASYMYYAIGDRANRLIDVVTKTIYVTEPNMSLEELRLEHDIGFFSMNINFDVYKKIGKEDYKAGNYDIDFLLDKANFPKKNLNLDRPLAEYPDKDTEVLFHPKASVPFNRRDQWDMLNKLPNGTVAEVYISLNDVMKPEELKKILPKNMELRWLAVDTGLDAAQVDGEGVPITPLGYPAQYDPTTWSPFKTDNQTNEEVFLDILSLLEKNESIAEKVARAKSLSLKSRIAYIKKHGIKVYGAVITGPTEELRKLENVKEISTMKVGEVKLWNWE